MLYLKASEIQPEFLDEYNGEKGQFIKTFAINDQRNKNGWRVTWPSIKKHIHTALGMPGIEYVKCEGTVCDLDHTDGATFQQSLQVQEPFRVTTLVDFQLDEASHTAYFVHKALDDDFYQKVKAGEIKFVSPSIWPSRGGFEILGRMENGLPIVDVYDWKFLHDAFVNKPAFGDDAKITATCEGENCMMRMLAAAEQVAVATTYGPGGEELAPIKTVPILVRHKNKLVFVSVTEEEYRKIAALEKLTEEELIPILRTANTSFTICGCSGNRMDEEDRKKMESMKKAVEDKDEEIKDLKSKMKAMEDEYHKKAKKGAEEDDEKKEKQALDREEEERKMKSKTAKEEDPVVKAQNAKIAALEKALAQPLVAKMVSARKAKGASDEQAQEFEQALSAKSLEEIKSTYANEEILIKDLLAKQEGEHFEFNGGASLGALTGKSLEEIFEEATA